MSNNEQERKPQMCELKMPIEAVMTAIPTGWKITQVCSDDYLLGKFGFTHTVKEHRRDVYTKIVEREVRGGGEDNRTRVRARDLQTNRSERYSRQVRNQRAKHLLDADVHRLFASASCRDQGGRRLVQKVMA